MMGFIIGGYAQCNISYISVLRDAVESGQLIGRENPGIMTVQEGVYVR